MKRMVLVFLVALLYSNVNGQTINPDTTGKVVVHRDPRLDILGSYEAEINKNTVGLGTKAAKGYRLLIVSSNDRNYAMKVRTALLQRYPEEKVYMTYQAPFIKLKFGNFISREDADRYRKMITSSKIVTTNVYLVPELVEVKVDRTKEIEEN